MALIIAFAISIAILGVASLPAVYAQDDAPKAKRTIMYYEDGCDPLGEQSDEFPIVLLTHQIISSHKNY